MSDLSPGVIYQLFKRKDTPVMIDKNWYQSKKVWITLATFTLILLKALFPHSSILDGLDETKIGEWVAIAASFVLAQGHLDAKVRSAALIADAMTKTDDTTKQNPS